MDLSSLQEPIQKELSLVNTLMQDTLLRCQHPEVSQMSEFVLKSLSKQIRPTLILLTFKAFCQDDSLELSTHHDVIRISCAMELMHRASLIHDDMIDRAAQRHQRASLYAKWGAEVAVSMGNFVYSEAFHLASLCEHPQLVQSLTLATREMCQGELLQVCERHNPLLTVDAYYEIIRLKTASLFAASCEMGALAAGQSLERAQQFKQFGLSLGLLFQMVDDTMDWFSPDQELGKSGGQDLISGEYTLPLIHLFSVIAQDQKEQILQRIELLRDQMQQETARAISEHGKLRQLFQDVKELLKTTEAFKKIYADLNQQYTCVQEQLQHWPHSRCGTQMSQLVEFVAQRALRWQQQQA